MIKLSLFTVPILGMLLFLIPILGIFLYLIVVSIWYSRNYEDIHNYFRGVTYNKIDDVDKEYDKALI